MSKVMLAATAPPNRGGVYVGSLSCNAAGVAALLLTKAP
jgi:hypothetical protein